MFFSAIYSASIVLLFSECRASFECRSMGDDDVFLILLNVKSVEERALKRKNHRIQYPKAENVEEDVKRMRN